MRPQATKPATNANPKGKAPAAKQPEPAKEQPKPVEAAKQTEPAKEQAKEVEATKQTKATKPVEPAKAETTTTNTKKGTPQAAAVPPTKKPVQQKGKNKPKPSKTKYVSSEEEDKEPVAEDKNLEDDENEEDSDAENKNNHDDHESEDSEEKPKKISQKDEKKFNKLWKAGKITREEYEKAIGIWKEEEVIDEEAKAEALKREEYTSGLIAVTEKKGVKDSGTKDIKIEQFTLAYKSMVLLRDADLRISYGRKYGLIGPNGTGKSTLLRHISQRHFAIQEHIQILHVEQEIEGTDQLAIDAVVSADVERADLLKELEQLQPISEQNTEEGMHAHERLIEIHKRLRAIGAHSAEARASAILAGLQFTPEMQKKKTKEFSGGWRMRISLARALFILPDLLLLDEPTNHLDLDAVIWLEAYLKKYKKTLLLVSHDRDFLNGVVTDIICLREQKLEYYKGNYDSYEKGLTQTKKQQEKAYKQQQKDLAKIQDAQDKNARDKKKKIEKNGIVERLGKEYSVKFIFRDPGALGYPVIQVKQASFGYKPGKENLLFENLELNIDLQSRIAIVGPNGTGKSTLMNLILGELEPTGGEINRNRHLRVAKFSQHFVDQLNMTDTPVEYIAKKFPEMKQQEVRNKLGMFNLKGDLHNKPISLLSGGQKSRVAMAEIGLRMPHIFFLDEPTNHLDIQSVDALSQALQEFQGGIILITHDQRLVNSVAKELWVCRGNKKVEIYEGTFDDYKQEIIDAMPDELFIDSEEEN